MGRNRVNLKMQMLQALDAQRAYGTKKVKEKHGCDKQYNSNRSTSGIHSFKTMEIREVCQLACSDSYRSVV